MKKIVIFVLVGVLAFGLLGPASAKKKKPKKAPVPVELQYFLRTGDNCDTPFLSLTDGEDVDCVYADTGMSPVWEAAGIDWSMTYVAADGVPLVLDPTRKVAGTIGVRGWNTAGGVGPAEVDITLLGTIAGEEKELGTFNHTYTAGPAHMESVEFEMELDPALAGQTLEGLSLRFYASGPTVAGRGVEHDEPVSFIKVPALQ